MITKVLVPFLGANDTETLLQGWEVEPGKPVSAGDDLCILETTKATIDVQAEVDGLFFPAVEEDETVKTGQTIGFITDEVDFDISAHMAALAEAESSSAAPTKKAEMMIAKQGLDVAAVEAFAKGERITEQVVQDFIAKESGSQRRIGMGMGTKVAIIGGVSGGGALITADALARIPSLHGTAIYDQDARFHGQFVLGIPVLGTLERLQEDIGEGLVDAVVIAFNQNLEERHRVFSELVEQGVRFVNVIDPTADTRSHVDIGVGNVILGHAYVGAGSRIGDNNFVSANVALEHGNVLGSTCAFGPGVFTSGNVLIGDRVRFGTGIYVEPGVSIGDDSVIGSGQTLVTDIKSGTVLTSRAKA